LDFSHRVKKKLPENTGGPNCKPVKLTENYSHMRLSPLSGGNAVDPMLDPS